MSTISDEPSVDMITVDGATYFEVTIDDPDGEGFLVERIPVDKTSSHSEIEEEIEAAKERLVEERENRENPENDWREEFADLTDQT